MQVEAVVHSSKKMSIFQFLGTLVLGKLGKTDLEVDLSLKWFDWNDLANFLVNLQVSH